MKYVEFRRKWQILIYFFGFLLIIISGIVGRHLIYFIVGIIFIGSLLETVLIICPNCKEKPVSLLKQFPKKCKHCGENF